MRIVILINFIYSFLLIISCTSKESDMTEVARNDSLKSNDTLLMRNIAVADTNYKGIMLVPEQLALCLLDSAGPRESSQKMQENYNKIMQDVEYLQVSVADQPGCIFYSVSPDKIVFETFMLLKSKPKKNAVYSKLVILESTLGLLYDHYGTFNTIHNSYRNIEQIMRVNGLKQSGPAREIYVLNDDTSKWRTRIIVPVVRE